jgi:hypothetical protein
LRKFRIPPLPPPGPPDLFGNVENYHRRPDGRLVEWRRFGRVSKRWPWPLMTTNCVDCGIGTLTIHEWYMVNDDVWEQAWAGRRKSWRVAGQEILCIGCLERRLGRTLIASDFVPGNPNKGRVSERMRDRLAATVTRRLRGRPRGTDRIERIPSPQQFVGG